MHSTTDAPRAMAACSAAYSAWCVRSRLAAWYTAHRVWFCCCWSLILVWLQEREGGALLSTS